MNKVTSLKKIPENSIIAKDFGKLDYADSYQIHIKSDKSLDTITSEIFNSTTGYQFLLKIRDFVVGIFGLKTSKDVEIKIEPYYPIGSRLALFTVIDRGDTEIVMGENDKHLNFRTSVKIESNVEDKSIFLTTIVQYNNFWGKLYFFPVKPFHQIIIKSLLKRYAHENK